MTACDIHARISTLASASLASSRRRRGALAQRARRPQRIRELIVTLELAPGLAGQRARADGAARARAHARARGAAHARAGEARRGLSPPRHRRLARRRRRPRRRSPRCGSRSRASRPATRPSARTPATARSPARSSPSCPESPRADDERALIELDQRIHRHVYRCAHNPFLESTLNEYYTLTLRIWFLALDRVARLDDAVTEHGELLQAICDGDAGRAEDVMRRHIEGFERAIRAVL